MEKVIVMIDAGFLSKVSYKLGEGHYFKYDLLKFARNLSEKEQLIFKHLFFYNAPPFQSSKPPTQENKRKEDYDSFTQKLNQNQSVNSEDPIMIRERNAMLMGLDDHFN